MASLQGFSFQGTADLFQTYHCHRLDLFQDLKPDSIPHHIVIGIKFYPEEGMKHEKNTFIDNCIDRKWDKKCEKGSFGSRIVIEEIES